MPSCLGLYVQNNLIKYAKVSKDHDMKKVESFGIKFYEGNVNSAIKQIVEETYSFKTPISINITNENYNYFNMFSLLSKKDLQKAIKTEFEAYCSEKSVNPNVFETRNAVVPNVDDAQKLRVLFISENKIELNKRAQLISEYKAAGLVPISMAIANLHEFDTKENALIVNIEDSTTITTILNKRIYDVQQIPEGSQEILENINLKENSYAKSYEMCKNTTIYTSEGSGLQETETTHLEDIMPTLYTIVGNVKKILNEQTAKIEKVYITGTAALINNIDLYFQEYLKETNCEILKPDFVTNTRDISIKDYIEVNSAISIALMGLGEGIEEMNFKNQSLQDKLPDWLKIETKSGGTSKGKPKIRFDLKEKLDKIEKNILRGAYTTLILIVVYSAFAVMLNNQLDLKQQDAEKKVADIQSQISLAQADDNKIKAKTAEYTTLINEFKKINDETSEKLKTRNMIPNFLNQIMYVIPENVQITSIQNTSDRHIEINAQSDKYEQLGYFKAKLKSAQILTDVISTSGQKDGNAVTVKIEGDIP
ncbi:MAG: hypothetical protein IKF38_00365 [Clostridia bacterium]|nr:hypothetical protein [Clostridia bacterium]